MEDFKRSIFTYDVARTNTKMRRKNFSTENFKLSFILNYTAIFWKRQSVRQNLPHKIANFFVVTKILAKLPTVLSWRNFSQKWRTIRTEICQAKPASQNCQIFVLRKILSKVTNSLNWGRLSETCVRKCLTEFATVLSWRNFSQKWRTIRTEICQAKPASQNCQIFVLKKFLSKVTNSLNWGRLSETCVRKCLTEFATVLSWRNFSQKWRTIRTEICQAKPASQNCQIFVLKKILTKLPTFLLCQNFFKSDEQI